MTTEQTEKDPVCGMNVDPEARKLSSEHDGESYHFCSQGCYDKFAAEPEAYLKRSPLSLVGNVTTPTMLLTGEEDYRTPMSESEQFYQALKLRRVPAALVRVPGASHGIARRPSQLIAKVRHVLAWFERFASSGATPN